MGQVRYGLAVTTALALLCVVGSLGLWLWPDTSPKVLVVRLDAAGLPELVPAAGPAPTPEQAFAFRQATGLRLRSTDVPHRFTVVHSAQDVGTVLHADAAVPLAPVVHDAVTPPELQQGAEDAAAQAQPAGPPAVEPPAEPDPAHHSAPVPAAVPAPVPVPAAVQAEAVSPQAVALPAAVHTPKAPASWGHGRSRASVTGGQWVPFPAAPSVFEKKTLQGWGVTKKIEWFEVADFPSLPPYNATAPPNSPCCDCPVPPKALKSGGKLKVNGETCFNESGTDESQKKEGVHGYCQPLGPEHYPTPHLSHIAPGPPPASSIARMPEGLALAELALGWIETHTAAAFDSTAEEALVVDYGYRAARPYLLPHRLPRLWTFVTALVPDLKGESPQPQPLPLNQIVWANPTAHRILALAATMNFFDYQLLLRLGDMPTITQLNLTETIGQLLPMAKHTLLVLPCGIEDDEAFLQAAMDDILARNYSLGLHNITYRVERLTELPTRHCTKTLLRVSLTMLDRGVRHTWCYHRWPFTWKFTLQWHEGDVPFLANHMSKHLPGGDKRLKHWTPNINLSELLAWGVSKARRALFQIDMFHYPAASDPNSQNWLVAKGGRLIRIDFDNTAQDVITGRDYIRFLSLQTCVQVTGPLLEACRCCQHCLNWGWAKHAFPPMPVCHDCYHCAAVVLAGQLSPAAQHPTAFMHCGRENFLATKVWSKGHMHIHCYHYVTDYTGQSREFY